MSGTHYSGWPSLRLDDFDSLYTVVASYAVDYVHPFDYLTEDRVTAIEVRLRRVSDEELAAAHVLARQCHADSARLVTTEIYLVSNLIARPAVLIAARVAALNNEVRHHSHER